MTIDEVIILYEEMAEEVQKVVNTHIISFMDCNGEDTGVTLDEIYCDDTEIIEKRLEAYRKDANDYRQFAEWLKELKILREQTSKGVTVTDFADKCRECGKQTKWIPVTEKVPRHQQRVLVTVVRYDGSRNVRVAKYNCLSHVFRILENSEEWRIGDEGLLAWCSLPEPYGEKEDENDAHQ